MNVDKSTFDYSGSCKINEFAVGIERYSKNKFKKSIHLIILDRAKSMNLLLVLKDTPRMYSLSTIFKSISPKHHIGYLLK